MLVGLAARGDVITSPAARSGSKGAICSTWIRMNGRGKASSWPSSTRWRSPGVNNAYFLKAALNAKRKHHGEPELDAMEFMQLIKAKT